MALVEPLSLMYLLELHRVSQQGNLLGSGLSQMSVV
ncbi:hypothetical protein Tco_0580069, partial [Tanacetum coccineum]